MENLDEIVAKLKIAFKKENIKKAILQDEWYSKNMKSGIHSTGFCYSACEVIYRLTGGKTEWKKVSISQKKWNLGGHCYLINKKTNEILDITSDQYEKLNIKIPYELGIAGGFRSVTKSAIKLCELAEINAEIPAHNRITRRGN